MIMYENSSSREVKINYLTRSIYRFISLIKCKEIISEKASNGIAFFEEIRVETRTSCNASCNFCPSSVQNTTRPDILMSEECFYKIIDELAGLNYSGVIKLYINNEPLMDKRLPGFLKYIDLKHMRLKEVLVQTNGLLLTYKLGCRLFENGLTRLIVNDYSRDGKTSQKHIAVVQKLRLRFPDKKIEFLQRSFNEVLSNRAGLAPNLPLKMRLDSACKHPIMQMNITANGNVGFCCVDVFVKNPLGNVMKQGLADIWCSKVYETFRRELSQGKRSKYDLCRYCEYQGYLAPPQRFSPIFTMLTHLARQLRNYQVRRFMQR
jgi:radical SAM protein with 4Fe4S-binding SPASM domain